MVKQKKQGGDPFPQEDFKKRLISFMNKVQKNGQELAVIAGISKQSVSGYMGTSLPTAPVLTAWSRELDLNVNWLLLGEGPMFRGDSAIPEQEKALKDEIIRLHKKLESAQDEIIALHKAESIRGQFPLTQEQIAVSSVNVARALPKTDMKTENLER